MLAMPHSSSFYPCSLPSPPPLHPPAISCPRPLCLFLTCAPFAVDYPNADLGVDVSLEAFNPCIPFDSKSSAYPGIIFNFTVNNPSDEVVQVRPFSCRLITVDSLTCSQLCSKMASLPGNGEQSHRIHWRERLQRTTHVHRPIITQSTWFRTMIGSPSN